MKEGAGVNMNDLRREANVLRGAAGSHRALARKCQYPQSTAVFIADQLLWLAEKEAQTADTLETWAKQNLNTDEIRNDSSVSQQTIFDLCDEVDRLRDLLGKIPR